MSFSLQPGHYTYAALHPELGHQTGGLDIPACLTADCPGIPLKIVFANKGQKARLGVGPKSFYIAAGALLAGGIVLGALAVDTDSEIRQYSNKRQEGFGIDDLIEERDDYALAADGLFIAGGASLVTAMIWHWTGTPE